MPGDYLPLDTAIFRLTVHPDEMHFNNFEMDFTKTYNFLL